VMGTWGLDVGGQKNDLLLEQTFQKINGSIAFGNIHAGLREARLRGPQIAFAYVDQAGLRREFVGTVNGRSMSGNFRDDKGQTGNWSATKK